MQQVTLCMEPILVQFYARIADLAGRSTEDVMADALFKLAGELSLESLCKA